MRRHGWTFCLGLLVAGPALAQPPADTERFPPAPDLPATLVSKPAGGRPVATAGPLPVRPASLKASDAPPAPLPLEPTKPAKAMKAGPYLPVASAVLAPPAPAPAASRFAATGRSLVSACGVWSCCSMSAAPWSPTPEPCCGSCMRQSPAANGLRRSRWEHG